MKKKMIALLLTAVLAGSACFALTGCKKSEDEKETTASTVAATEAAEAAQTPAATTVEAAGNDSAASVPELPTDWVVNDYDDDDDDDEEEIDYHAPMNYTDEGAVEKVFSEKGYGEGYSASSGGWVTIPGDTDIWHNVLIYQGYEGGQDSMIASFYLNDRTDEILSTVELEARAYGDTLSQD